MSPTLAGHRSCSTNSMVPSRCCRGESSRSGFRSNPKRSLAALSAALTVLHFGLWLTAAPPLLSEPNQSNGQFGFTLTGDANVPYIIEGSSNLAIWRPLTTNLDPASVRSISVNATSQWNFYRVHQAQPLFAFALACKESLDLNVNSLASD